MEITLLQKTTVFYILTLQRRARIDRKDILNAYISLKYFSNPILFIDLIMHKNYVAQKL